MLITLGIASFAILIGVILRHKITFLGKAWIPGTIVAGVLAMIILNVFCFSGLDVTHISDSSEQLVDICFDIIIICMPFTMNKKKGQSKILIRGGIQFSMIGVLSITMLMTLGVIFAKLTFPVFGMEPEHIANYALGFTMGPGQAMIQGKLLEINGLADAYTIGMAFASMGFLMAFLFGIPFILLFHKKSKSDDNATDLYEKKGIYPNSKQPKIHLSETISHSTIDTFTFHIAFVLAMLGVVMLAVNFFKYTNMNDSLVGILEFVLCLIVGLVMKAIFRMFKLKHVIDCKLISRIVNVAGEYLVVLAFFSVNLSVLKTMIIPIIMLSLIGGFLSVVVFYFLCKASDYPYPIEQFVLCLGTFTGTIGSGLALLHMVDPEMESAVWKQIPYGNSFSMFGLLPISLVITLVSTGVMSVELEQIIMAITFILVLVVYCFVFIKPARKKYA